MLMKAPLRTRTFVASVLAASLVALPSNAALAAPPPAQPTAPASPTSSSAPAAPASSTPAPAAPVEPTAPAPADPNAPAEVSAPTDETGVPLSVPVEEPAEGDQTQGEQTQEKPPETPETVVPEGPERPPEPTLGNGKFKAKGTGLMIAGGTLLGLGLVGMVTSIFLTRCTELDNSFACRNQHNNTFAVPATGAAALLGAVLLAVGVTYRVRYKRWESWDPNRARTAFYPTFTPQGVGAGAMLKF